MPPKSESAEMLNDKEFATTTKMMLGKRTRSSQPQPQQ
jgi:hypothetical protein